MSGMGMALMGAGVGRGEHRAIDAAQKAVASPLLDDTSIEGAKGILINFTGGSDLSIHEVEEAARIVQEAAHEEANIIFGAVIDPDARGRGAHHGDRDRLHRAQGGRRPRRPRSSRCAKGPRGTAQPSKDWRRRISEVRGEADGASYEEDLDVPAFLRRQAD